MDVTSSGASRAPVAFATLVLAACGGGNGSAPPVTVGGTVSGLAGSGLVLADNGGDLLSVANNGPFTFATRMAGGGAYNVTVRTQPANPNQTCAVAGGSGQALTGNVTGVSVTCTINRYTVGGGVSGLDSGRSLMLQDNGGDDLTVTRSGAFAFATKIASGSAYAVTVLTQPAGQNCTVTLGSGTMLANDVGGVAVSCTDRTWVWVSGSNTANAAGTYGTLGIGSTTNVPGARQGATSWSDNAGNLWLFGGSGYDSTGGGGTLNDLWKYTPSNQQWTWVSGANTGYGFEVPSGVYGTLGVAAATNVPPARTGAASWTDNAGNLWMFGGLPNDTGLPFNDLWKYAPSTQQWTWMGGANTVGAAGTYGTLGVGSIDNVPGAHQLAASWTDKDGNFWLFGGQGNDAKQAFGLLGDLWRFTPSTQQWTWMGGADTADPNGNALGNYGKLGIASATNLPGERFGAASWTDSAGNLWLFGGSLLYSNGQLNDLWKYTPSTGQWTWMSGANTVNAQGMYGTLGIGSKTNVPRARYRPIAWTDTSGNLWLFGGYFIDSTATPTPPAAFGMLNDLWVYTPSSQQWTWVSGSNTPNAAGIYGTEGIGSPTNVPTARELAISWIDSSGDFWLFGGAGPFGELNDLWRY